MHVLLLRSNNPVKRIRPNLVSTAEAWIPEKQFHDAWHVSCGVNSPNSLATILGTVNLNANLSHNVFHLHEQTYQYLSLITDSHSDSQNSSSLGNKNIHQFLVPATCLPPKDLSPASSNFPCCCKRRAKSFMEVSVSGCCGPSWDSQTSKARRCSPSASRLEMER